MTAPVTVTVAGIAAGAAAGVIAAWNVWPQKGQRKPPLGGGCRSFPHVHRTGGTVTPKVSGLGLGR